MFYRPNCIEKFNFQLSDASVNYKRVTFEYPTRPGTKVLNELDLDVTSGKTIALIGASGCGKSTIVQLIQRFYDPDSGSVVSILYNAAKNMYHIEKRIRKQ